MISYCLKRVCLTKYVIGFKEGRKMGAQFARQYVSNGKIFGVENHQETLEQKFMIKSRV
ncbi:hypothetical protein DPMN_112911 [Dreissena polymorpha]|uniref:Uncharacterized protein n=1 Tax=Dreissena polymorpha TaxID=45954 RepID=A0A9D4KGI8_DREPO|nr:hypothetical protein DPMN_112911 [Dreissena polymorpha]